MSTDDKKNVAVTPPEGVSLIEILSQIGEREDGMMCTGFGYPEAGCCSADNPSSC